MNSPAAGKHGLPVAFSSVPVLLRAGSCLSRPVPYQVYGACPWLENGLQMALEEVAGDLEGAQEGARRRTTREGQKVRAKAPPGADEGQEVAGSWRSSEESGDLSTVRDRAAHNTQSCHTIGDGGGPGQKLGRSETP